MDIFALIAAFGGGLIGAYLGALPAFILTGIVALAGAVAAMAGAADVSVGLVAFGVFLGPHIAFAGGVGASAYAGKKKLLGSGSDITSSLNGLGDPMVIIVGGLFGIAGFLINYVISLPAVVAVFPTDTPGFCVIVLGIIARLVFGTSGLTGKFTGSGKREFFSTGKGLAYNVVLGAGIGILTGGLSAFLYNSGAAAAVTGSFPILCFGIAATSLIFTQTGFATPATHHIFYPSSVAAIGFGAAFGPAGALAFGIIFGVIGSLLGDFMGKTFNSYNDTHIDPPAFTILTLIAIIGWLKMVLL